MSHNQISVAIVDNEAVPRHGLIAAVESAADLNVLCAVSSILELDRELLLLGAIPQVVLLDLALGGGLEGIEAVAHLHQRGLAVLVVSAHFRDGTVLDALAAGAHGILPKSTQFTEIARATRTVASGAEYRSPETAAILLRASEFPPHQRRILELVAQGATDREIAKRLNVSTDAVTGQLDRIGPKAGGRKRPSLTEFFHRHWREPRDEE